MTFTLFEIIVFIVAYLICSVSPAIIICRLVRKEDIRKLGSGNAGTTNALRILGKFWGFIVFILDILKVLASYYCIYILCIVFHVSFDDDIIRSSFLLGAIIGHCYPVYYGLKGGKGIVALMVSIFLINKQIAAVCVVSGLVLILTTRMVSVGSIGGSILLLIMTFIMMPEYIIVVSIVVFIVIFKHRSNIVKIMNKKELKLF